jgi:hypothetical protein
MDLTAPRLGGRFFRMQRHSSFATAVEYKFELGTGPTDRSDYTSPYESQYSVVRFMIAWSNKQYEQKKRYT